MLVLSRQRDEKTIIEVGGKLIEVMVVDIRGDKVRLGFEAADDVRINRLEVWERIQRECERNRNEQREAG